MNDYLIPFVMWYMIGIFSAFAFFVMYMKIYLYYSVL